MLWILQCKSIYASHNMDDLTFFSVKLISAAKNTMGMLFGDMILNIISSAKKNEKTLKKHFSIFFEIFHTRPI